MSQGPDIHIWALRLLSHHKAVFHYQSVCQLHSCPWICSGEKTSLGICVPETGSVGSHWDAMATHGGPRAKAMRHPGAPLPSSPETLSQCSGPFLSIRNISPEQYLVPWWGISLFPPARLCSILCLFLRDPQEPLPWLRGI